jgi:hypothetical protein
MGHRLQSCGRPVRLAVPGNEAHHGDRAREGRSDAVRVGKALRHKERKSMEGYVVLSGRDAQNMIREWGLDQ